MRWPARAALGLGIAAGLLAVGLLIVFFWYRQASLPMHEGTLRVRGPHQAIEIRRDAAGVAYVLAVAEDDALFGLGFAHAQDRLWQMDFNRRIAQGRVSELVGPAGLEVDRFIRTLGVQQIARRMVEELDADTRAHVAAYVAGINAALAARTGPLPPEFILTRAPAPAPWTAQDSAAWAVMMALDLGQTWRDEIARLLLAARLSKAQIDELRPDPDGEPPLVSVDYVESYRLMGLFAPSSALLDAAARLAALPALSGAADGEAIGSNDWVVAGSRTRSGQPLLANDPHLGLTNPGVFYFASLRVTGADGFHSFGATVPGLPYVVIGRNQDVAWGMTNCEADAEDLYIERINPADGEQYQTPEGWAPFAMRDEVIRVKGEADVRLQVRQTRHGPVLSDALAALRPKNEAGDGENKQAGARPTLAPQYVLAMRWVPAEPGDRSLRAIRELNRARNADELRAALRDLTLIRQNVVFAERQGRDGQPGSIGLQVAGRIPLRKPDNEFRGQVPAPGWSAQYDWAGFVPYDELPRVINPASGFVASANARVAHRAYPLHVASTTFAPRFRVDRINQLLAAQAKHDVASMERIQIDQTSLAARALLPLLARAQPQSAAGKVALARLQQWDGTMRVEAPEPLLYHAWLRELRRRIFEDDLGEHLGPRREMPVALIGVLDGRFKARDWCDDQRTQRHESCEELLSESLDDSVRELGQSTGRDVLSLRWGKLHPAVLMHRPLSSVPLVRAWFERRLPVGGDTDTINVAAIGRAEGAPYAAVHGPVMRMIADLSGNGGAWISVSAQDGHPLADDDVDLAIDWQHGRYRPIEFDARSRRVLRLLPAR